MSACCDHIGQNFPEAGVACREIERRYRFACTEMDTEFPVVDYRSGSPRIRVEAADGNITANDVLRWATALSALEWLTAFRQRRPLNPARSLFGTLPREFQPPFVITNPAVLEAVRERIASANSERELLASLVAYHFQHVQYTPIADDQAPTADVVYAKGQTSCLPFSMALYGLLQLGGMFATMAEQPQPAGQAFHIGVMVQIGGQWLFIDPAAPDATQAITAGAKGIALPDTYVLPFYWSELVHSKKLPVAWLQRAHAMIPQDFHLTYSLSKFHAAAGEMAEARRWYHATQQLYPGVLP